MKKIFLIVVVSLFSISIYSQIEGIWKTIDDDTNKESSIVEIWKSADGKYYGKIVKLFNAPENLYCTKCTGKLKNKPLIGLQILQGLKKQGDEFTGGTITDPENGKPYKCTIKREGNRLKVRGYIGISLIGRTQIWHLLSK
ncbi:MAG: hypothetical protein CSA89_00360 [Bacteroidales bacterium]|nr:MAG: hypothetical protein CSA89_00360 [Bacteroidales bacterium]